MTSPNLAGPHLLVPIDLAALVSTTRAPAEGFVSFTPDYDVLLLPLTLGDRMLPDPFARAVPPEPGVHLHWAMPDGLTKGRQEQDAVRYPLLPNRWLVVRRYWSATRKRALSTAWVVASDAVLDDEHDGGGTAWAARAADGSWGPARLGRTVPLGSFGGDDAGQPPLFLTAIGAGDPAFAAAYPSCRGVYGLYDPLDEVPSGDLPAAVSYTVCGWYSDASAEPLVQPAPAGTTWADRLAALGWSVAAGAHGEPTSILLHGQLNGVAWRGRDAEYEDGVPAGHPQVSVGNSAVEALSALVGALLPDDPAVEELVQAFQYGLLERLDDLDGPMNVAEAVHASAFSPAAAGVRFDVRPTSQDGEPAPASDPLPDTVGAALRDLNAHQAAVEEGQRALDSARRVLYATWYLKAMLDVGPGPGLRARESAPTADEVASFVVDTLIPRVDRAKSGLDAAVAARDRARAALDAEVARRLPGHEAAERTTERYATPNNPVVVVSGDGVERSLRHGEDGRFAADGTLVCRTGHQLVASLSLESVTLEAAALAAPFFDAIPAAATLPAEASALAVESILLDPAAAEPLARAALAKAGKPNPTQADGQRLREEIASLQATAWDAGASAFGGRLPSEVAVVAWKQPWIPLLLQWTADWYPSAETPAGMLAGWELADCELAWTGGSPTAHGLTQLSGSAPLNARTTVNLTSRLAEYVDHHPDDPNRPVLERIGAACAALDVVSQTLNGLESALVGQRATLQFPVVDPVDPDLGEQVADRVGQLYDVTPYPDQPGFFPIRAGHLRLDRLAIVDAYGRRQDLVGGSLQAPPEPIFSAPLRTAGHPALAQLPPRIVQSSRLLFRWLGDEPVAGWLLPNHLDASLMLFAPAGGLLGELQLIDRAVSGGTGTGVRWVAAPGEPAALGRAPSFPDEPHLEAFARAILAAGVEGRSGLADLLAVADETQWTVNPFGAWQDQSLASLIGRPLALCRASLRLELAGSPEYDRTWPGLAQLVRTGDFPTAGFTEVPIEVVLGDVRRLADGLVGFFVGDDYGRFVVAQHGLDPPFGSTYVVAAEPVAVVADPHAVDVEVSLLVDPRGVVHATTGLLPTASLGLSPERTAAALARMEVAFAAGPLVTDSVNLSVPLPAASGGTWSWLGHPSPSEWQRVDTIAPVSPVATLGPTPAAIREGWLRLAGALGENGRHA